MGRPRAVWFLALIALVVALPLSANCPNFTLSNPYGQFINFNDIVVGDFNGDGRLDFAAVEGSGTLHVLLQQSDGSFPGLLDSSGYTVPVGWYIAAADLNGDGKLDLVTSNLSSGGISVLLANPANPGTFNNATTYSTPGWTQRIAIADFNRDGLPDIAVAQRSGSDGVVVFLNNPVSPGTFLPGVTYQTGALTSPLSVVAADFNRDGILDLAVLNTDGFSLSIFTGVGNGTFTTPPTTLDLGTFYSHDVIARDFNRDGRIDLAIAEDHGGSASYVAVFLQDSGGNFGSFVEYPVSNASPSQIVAADFNGDGFLDLATSDQGGAGAGSLSVLLGDGNGAFGAPTDIPFPTGPFGQTPQPRTIAAADFNRDGRIDLIGGDFSAQTASIAYNTGTCVVGCGIFTSTTPYGAGTASTFPTAAIGDFNRDGIPDFVVTTGTGTSNNVQTYLGNGLGGFSVQPPMTAGTSPEGVAVADIDRDGKPDLVVANETSNNISIFPGTGTGGFNTPSTIPLTAGNLPRYVVVGDFNRDGRPDIAVTNTGTGNIAVLLQSALGTYPTVVNYTVGTSPQQIEVGDVNGDGIPDLVIANNGSNNVSVLLGAAAGTFTAATGSPFAAGTGPRAVAIGDFNRDGIPDLAVASDNGNVTILPGDGSGSFSTISHTYPAGASPSSIIAVDVNQDGVLDLVVSDKVTTGSSNVSVLLGNGDGTFQPAVGGTTGAAPMFVTAGDLNRDGKVDLLFANASAAVQASVNFSSCITSDLAITKTHTGNFYQGQTGASYTITVANVGTGPTTGAVSVTDTLPAGLTATGLTGTNWSCDTGTLKCTRNDALASGGSYETITLTVNVDAAATGPVTNTATVSVGNDTNSANDTANDLTQISLPPPAGVSAIATSTTAARVTWTAVTGAVKYRVYRSLTIATGFTMAAEIVGGSTTTFDDSGLASGTTYVYYVTSVNAGSVESIPSNVDPATTVMFSDDPIVSGSTLIKAAHIAELRAAVNALRAAAVLPAMTYANSAAAGTPIRAVDIDEIRTGMNEALTAIIGSSFSFTDPTLTAGTTAIKSQHVQEPRQASQ